MSNATTETKRDGKGSTMEWRGEEWVCVGIVGGATHCDPSQYEWHSRDSHTRTFSNVGHLPINAKRASNAGPYIARVNEPRRAIVR